MKIDLGLMKMVNIKYQEYVSKCIRKSYMDDCGRTHIYYEDPETEETKRLKKELYELKARLG